MPEEKTDDCCKDRRACGDQAMSTMRRTRLSGGTPTSGDDLTLRADDDEADAAEEGNAAEDGWYENGMRGVVADLDGSDFGVLFVASVAEAADGEADDPNDDEQDADDGCRLHVDPSNSNVVRCRLWERGGLDFLAYAD